MRFYLCQTANGPRYARTQADAKALDPKFEAVEHATDQASLVALFNDFLSSAPKAAPRDDEFDAPAPIPAPEPKVIVRGLTPGEKTMALINARTNVEECIWIQDEAGLAKLDAIILERRQELAAANVPVAVEPRKRG